MSGADEIQKVQAMTQLELIEVIENWPHASEFARSVCAYGRRHRWSGKQFACMRRDAEAILIRKASEAPGGSGCPVGPDAPRESRISLSSCGQPGPHSALQIAFDAIDRTAAARLESNLLQLKSRIQADGKRSPIYVTLKPSDGYVFYVGKIQNGFFRSIQGMMQDERDRIETELLRIAANPKEVAIEYGRATGKCSCCGRVLTDPDSIAAGIGPICAEKWGF